MRYTEYEFKVDHFFDILRIVCCSLFRAPIQLVNEISKKIVYIEKKILRKVCFGGLVINLALLIINGGYNLIRLHRLNFVKGNLPLASLLIGLVFSVLLLTLVDRIKEPKFIEGSKRPKAQPTQEQQEQTVEEIYQEDSLEDLAKLYGSDTTYKDTNELDDLITIDDSEEPTNPSPTLDDFSVLSKISSINDEENLKSMLANIPDIISEAERSQVETNLNNAVKEDKFNTAQIVPQFSEADIEENLANSFDNMSAMRAESDNYMRNVEAKFGYNLEDLNQDSLMF